MVRRVRFSIVAIAVLAGVAVAQGCGQEKSRPAATAQTKVTSATIDRGEHLKSPVVPVDNEPTASSTASADSVFRVAAARCDHEFACGMVGRNNAYASRDECLSEKMVQARQTYRDAQCPGGIEQDKLDTCVATIRTTGCDADIGEPDYLTSCTASVLCRP